ncbi:hypothetical protein [Papillibacter cinnamivorans]|uniref:Uncharacterized protein n=1 Tax=Papillibacter cinnamivorans DSM 12816 TaxID=1122930 RepID=A0A1W2A5J4_9FIRM|nr:hypothetical protein [Papillibacter cinnamivorans]SMC55853.1 hypothetical protein SAMN02745168_1509 [Papillibacter cinnamivorans DSM 12816]
MQTLYFASDCLVQRNSNVLDFCQYKAARERALKPAGEEESFSEATRVSEKPARLQKNRLKTVRDAADLAATLFIAVFLCTFSICFFML